MFYVFNAQRLWRILKALFILIVLFAVLLFALFHFYPVRNLDIINKYAEIYDLEPEFICAVINVESGFDENVVSNKGASGLMQIMKTTADWAAEETYIENYSYENIFDFDLNTNIGCWYLSWLMDRYDEDYTLVLAAYNAGSGNVAKWLSDERYSPDGKKLSFIPFEETRNYVEKVKRNQTVYGYILDLFGGFL